MPPRLRLLLDFDGTLTQTDTLSALAHTTLPSQIWTRVSEAYASDLSAHAAAYAPPASARRALREEAAWLDSLRAVERASLRRGREAGAWSAEAVERGARAAVRKGEVRMRDGWRGWLREGAQVLSVNWSAVWVRACLSAAAGEEEGEGGDGVRVVANEVVGGEEEEAVLLTSGDKLEHLCRAVDGEEGVVIYVGDSGTDLEPLVAADVGVCVRDEPIRSGQKELAETCERLGVEVKRLADVEDGYLDELSAGTVKSGQERRQKVHGTNDGALPILWWVNDLHELHEFLRTLSARMKKASS